MKNLITIVFFLTIGIQINAQNFQWVKQVGGLKSVIANAMVVDAQGNTYTTGRFGYTTDFDPGPGVFNLICQSVTNYNAFILKLDAAGNFVWAKSFTGVGYGEGLSIAIDANNNIYTTGNYANVLDFDPGPGTYTNICASQGGIFVSKLDASGNFVWAKQLGDLANNKGHSIAVDPAGNVYTTGEFYNTSDFDPGPGVYTLAQPAFADAFISKLDASGNFVWAKSFSNYMVSGGLEIGYVIKADGLGNIYTSGAYIGVADFDPDNVNTYTLSSISSSRDIFISKLDASGNFVWAKSFGGGGQDVPNDIIIDSANNIYTTGNFLGNADFDPGTSTYTLNAAGQDVFISKLDANGNFKWAKSFGGPYADNAYSIKVNPTGSLYTIGTFSGTADFDPGSAVSNLTSTGGTDIFISRLDAFGNFTGAKQFGGPSSLNGVDGADIGKAITLDNHGNLFATGYFTGTSDFDPGPGIYNLISITTDIFVYKMSELAVGLEENSIIFDAKIYPNPTTAILNVELDEESFEKLTAPIQIEIINALGQILLLEEMNSRTIQLNTKKLNSGLYFLRLINGNTIITNQKIIKD